MTTRWILASIHLVALPLGVAAVWGRAAALRWVSDPGSLKRAFRADSIWGLAALLWLSTGLLRAFAGYEKGTAYYMSSHLFWLKMALFVLVVLLELYPAATLMRWRRRTARGEAGDLSAAATIARISTLQAFIVIAMVFVAAAMARGMGGA